MEEKDSELANYHEGILDVIDGKLKKPSSLDKNTDENEMKRHIIESDFYKKNQELRAVDAMTDILKERGRRNGLRSVGATKTEFRNTI